MSSSLGLCCRISVVCRNETDLVCDDSVREDAFATGRRHGQALWRISAIAGGRITFSGAVASLAGPSPSLASDHDLDERTAGTMAAATSSTTMKLQKVECETTVQYQIDDHIRHCSITAQPRAIFHLNGH